jgi:DNA-binding response OmpR family regulator
MLAELKADQKGGLEMARGWVIGEVKGRVLFIDDDQDTCEMMRTLLGLEGYEAVTASRVTEGLRLAKSERFDLILLDWYFADGTGIELCQMIRTFDKEIPIFFYTGVAYESEIKKALNAGAQGCFVKPVDTASLMQTVARYSASRDGRTEKK